MRNRASPDIMRRYASSALSNGRVSIMGRTSVSTLKSRVSWVSIALPVRLPMTERPPKISGTPLTGIGSPETPTTTSLPRTERPRKQAGDCGSAGGGRQDDVGTSQLLQCCSRILGLGVDVNVRSQLGREMFFVWTEADRNGAEAHLFGVLHAEMPQTADTLDSNGIASTSGVAERIECGDAGADQRGRIV